MRRHRDHRWARLAGAGVAGYLAGTLPSSDIAVRLAASTGDPRSEGSTNPGAANAAALLGRGWGMAVLGADMAKGAGAGALGHTIAGDGGAYLAATTSIAGHIAPIWSRFRGGKGVATSAGTCLAVFPAYFPIDAAVALAGAVTSRRAERAIQLSCAAWVGAASLWWWRCLPNGWGPAPSPGLVGFAAASSTMILARFRAARRDRGPGAPTPAAPTPAAPTPTAPTPAVATRPRADGGTR